MDTVEYDHHLVSFIIIDDPSSDLSVKKKQAQAHFFRRSSNSPSLLRCGACCLLAMRCSRRFAAFAARAMALSSRGVCLHCTPYSLHMYSAVCTWLGSGLRLGLGLGLGYA